MAKTTLLIALLLAFIGTLDVPDSLASQVTTETLKNIPLAFTKNTGQWNERVLFRTNAGGATMWFTKEGVTYQFTRRIEKNDVGPLSIIDSRIPGKDFEPDTIEQLVIAAKFVGANPNPEVVGEGLMEYKCNYFIGNDPTKWYADVPNYEGFTLRGVYPGVDIRFSGDGNGQAAYEFVVAPGADLAQIKVEYEGAEGTFLSADGKVILETKLGDLFVPFHAPSDGILSGADTFSQPSEDITTSTSDGSGQQALGTLAVRLSYSTYLGGSSYDYGNGIALDLAGNAYVTGGTWSSDFPTASPLDGSNNGTYDVFVAKLSPAGNSLVYSTYLGGIGYDEGYDIVVDSVGSAYVTGGTTSTDFPTAGPFDGSYNGGDYDVFVTKLGTAGNSLVYGTYLGGTYYDVGEGIAVDLIGSAYVTGATSSTDFPTASPFDGSYNGFEYDAFVTKLSPAGNSLVYSTYLGGNRAELGSGIAVDSAGSAYVTGGTWSSDFPTVGPFDGSYNGSYDVFVTKLSPAGNSLVYSTYLGGGHSDEGYDIAVDLIGSAYVTGPTFSSDFPTASPFDGSYNGSDGDAFITKLSPAGNSLVYSTYLGGGVYDLGFGIAVDSTGSAYVTGGTWSSDFPMVGPFDGSYNGSYDVFVTKLSPAGNSLAYSTYLGGYYDDFGYDIAVNLSGNAYVTGGTWSSDFPTANPFDSSFNGYRDAFVTKVSGVFICGDANSSGIVSVSDAVFLLSYLFAAGPAPTPLLSGDVDCSGVVDLSDAVYLINYIFSGGDAPCAACP